MTRCMTNPSLRQLASTLLAGALLLSGCASAADAGDRPASGGASGPVGVQAAASGPVDGGVLTYGTFSLPTSLDPAKTVASGSTGGTELAAVYDLLMRYDDDAGAFVPQLAEALEESDGATRWTLTLRDGVTFSNGTPLDADAVVWSIDRYVAERGPDSQLWADTVRATSVIDSRTIGFELNRPWPMFPAMLASGPGMVVARPSADGGPFVPVGAGPFVVATFQPHEVLALRARDDYWNGRPHLDEFRSVPVPDGKAQLDMLRAGELQMTYVFDAQVVGELLATDRPGYLEVMNAGSAILVNNAPGRPGSDPRVREAVIKAIDPVLVDQRAQAGQGRPSVALFPASSKWHSGAPDSRFDPEGARKLLQEAKSDGYDGAVTFTTRQAPEAKNRALAIQSLLGDVGFDVTIEYVTNIGDMIRVMNVERNYDLGQTGFNVRDTAPLFKLYSNLYSTSTGNVSGYTDPEMDRLLLELQAAEPDAAPEVIERIEERVGATVPMVPLAAQDNLVSWSPDVHGLRHSFAEIMLLGDAWIGTPNGR